MLQTNKSKITPLPIGRGNLWPIGQKELVKAAIIVGIQMIVAVLSCLQQDIPWTKRVGKIAFKY